MAVTVFLKLYYRSKDYFDFGNANISSFVSREDIAELFETYRKEKRN